MANGTGTLQGRSTNGIDDKYDADTLIFLYYVYNYVYNVYFYFVKMYIGATCNRFSF